MQLLNEAIRSKDFNSAQAIITKYLRSKLGKSIVPRMAFIIPTTHTIA
jgi:hypothetical protein